MMTSDGLGDSMNNKIMVNYLDITMIKKISTNTFHDTTGFDQNHSPFSNHTNFDIWQGFLASPQT